MCQVDELKKRRQSLESAKRQLEFEFSRLSDEQSSMNRGVVELLDAVRNVHVKLMTASQTQDSAAQRRKEYQQQQLQDEELGESSDGREEGKVTADARRRVSGQDQTVIEVDSSLAAIQAMILNLARIESQDLRQLETAAAAPRSDVGKTTANAMAAPTTAVPLLQLLRLENATLKTRLHQLAADGRQLRRQLDDVERLLTLVDEFKDENRALIEDWSKLKATMQVVERDEADELERFVDAYRETMAENERLRWRLDELTRDRQTREPDDTGTGSVPSAVTGTKSYEEPVAVEKGAYAKTLLGQFRAESASSGACDEVDRQMAPSVESADAVQIQSSSDVSPPMMTEREKNLEAENRALRDELERMKQAVDRQTVAMLEMDEALRRVSRPSDRLGIREVGEATQVAPPDKHFEKFAETELEKTVNDLRQTIQKKNAEIEELQSIVSRMRSQIEGMNEVLQTSLAVSGADASAGRQPQVETKTVVATYDGETSLESSEGMNRFLTTSTPLMSPKSCKASDQTSETNEQQPSTGNMLTTTSAAPMMATTITTATTADQDLISPLAVVVPGSTVTSTGKKRIRRQFSDDSGIARGHSSGSTRDEETYVCETDLAVAAVEWCADAENGEPSDDFESELSFDLARAMIDCQKVVHENRRLRRELGELSAYAAVKMGDESKVTVLSSRGRSSKDIRRGRVADEEETERENQKLRAYADELESEISALKRTVREQSLYLSASSTKSDTAIGRVDVVHSVAVMPTISETSPSSGFADGVKRRSFTGNKFGNRYNITFDDRCHEGEGCVKEATDGLTSSANLDLRTTKGSVGRCQNESGEVEESHQSKDDDDDRTQVTIESLRLQNLSLREELETTKRGWAEYESFADEARDRLMAKIERLRDDQLAAAKDDEDRDEKRQLSAVAELRMSPLQIDEDEVRRSRRIADEYRAIASQFCDRLLQHLAVASPASGKVASGVISVGNSNEAIIGGGLEEFRRRLESCLDAVAASISGAKTPGQSYSANDVVTGGQTAPESRRFSDGTRKVRLTSETDDDGGLLQVANITIDDLNARLAVSERQLTASERENERLRKQIDDFQHIKSTEVADETPAPAVAQPLGRDSGVRHDATQEAGDVAQQRATVAAPTAEPLPPPPPPPLSPPPPLDPDYEEQLLTEIEDLRAELRKTQRRLRDRDYELEETRDELLEENERLRRQADELRRTIDETKEKLDGDWDGSSSPKVDILEPGEKSTGAAIESLERQLAAVTDERDRLIEKMAALESKADKEESSTGQEQQRNDELEALFAVQDRVSAENGRLNAELVRCCAERQRAEERCKKLESDCLAFEELSNEMTERCQRLSAELMRTKSSSVPPTQPSAAAAKPVEQKKEEGGDYDDESATRRYQDLIEENSRLKVVLEMEKLKNFSSSREFEVSKADAQTETMDGDVPSGADVTRSRTDSRGASDDVIHPTPAEQHRLADHSMTSSWTVSVQQAVRRNAAVQTDEFYGAALARQTFDPQQPIREQEDSRARMVGSISFEYLLSETSALRSQLVELHFRLVSRLLEAIIVAQLHAGGGEDRAADRSPSVSPPRGERIGHRPQRTTAAQSSRLRQLQTVFADHSRRLQQQQLERSPTSTLADDRTSMSLTRPSESGDVSGDNNLTSRLRDENLGLSWLVASVDELVERLSSLLRSAATADVSTLDAVAAAAATASEPSATDEEETTDSLRRKIDELELKLKVQIHCIAVSVFV